MRAWQGSKNRDTVPMPTDTTMQNIDTTKLLVYAIFRILCEKLSIYNTT